MMSSEGGFPQLVAKATIKGGGGELFEDDEIYMYTWTFACIWHNVFGVFPFGMFVFGVFSFGMFVFGVFVYLRVFDMVYASSSSQSSTPSWKPSDEYHTHAHTHTLTHTYTCT